jgi:non-heme chloroperoxidase
MHQCCRLGRSVLLAFLAVPLYAQSSAVWKDPSPHITRFATIDKDVRLEVLDWGGSGKPIVLLAGGGDTAHVYDDFAPKLSTHYHVYGITRRGFGASGYSATDHPAKRLGDDVLAVIDALNLKRPILVGHSIAGVELSSVANSHPDRIAGVVYLDAAYSYAFDNGKGASVMDAQKLQGPQPPPPAERTWPALAHSKNIMSA